MFPDAISLPKKIAEVLLSIYFGNKYCPLSNLKLAWISSDYFESLFLPQ